MISKTVQDALNDQIKAELESAYLYQAMAAYFHNQGFDGMGQWMRVQALEEMTHAQKIFDFILERDGQVELKPLGLKKTHWEKPLGAFLDAYEHEQYITSRINDLVKLAQDERDFATDAMLQWFVSEQVEEEATSSKIAQELKLVGDNGHGLLMLDRELGTRVFTPPAASGE